MKRSGKILLEGTIEEFKKHCKGADNREYLLINTKEIKKDGTYAIYQQGSNNERVISISSKGKYGKLPPHSKQYLTFVALSDGTFTFWGSGTNTIQYSINEETWSNPLLKVNIDVQSGDLILWKGEMRPYGGPPRLGSFSSTAPFKIQGNIMSIYYGDNFINKVTIEQPYQFNFIFSGTKVTDAANLILPATTLADSCYFGMFQGCALLTTVPVLPATTLAASCYANMFRECTSLTTAPDLLATTLVQNCYSNMFYSCSSLNYIKMLATDISASNCLQNWVGNVAETGTMIVNGIDLPVGDSGVPSGWTVVDYVEE